MGVNICWDATRDVYGCRQLLGEDAGWAKRPVGYSLGADARWDVEKERVRAQMRLSSLRSETQPGAGDVGSNMGCTVCWDATRVGGGAKGHWDMHA